MTSQVDNITPRALTPEELRACWIPLYNDREKERGFGTSSQSDDLLPDSAKNGPDVGRYNTPSTYPELRTSYDLSSTGALIERQTLRTSKLVLIRDIVTGASQDYFGDIPHKVFRGLFKEWMTEGQSVIPNFKDCYIKALDLKTRGNELFRQGRWMEALIIYATSWGNLLPYHIHSFNKSDIQVFAYGKLESELFNNMMITLIQWSKNDPVLSETSKHALLGLALCYGQVVTEPVQSATLTVGTTYKACQRICDIARSLEGFDHPLKGHNALKPRNLDHYRYFVQLLKNVPKDKHQELLQRWDPSTRDRFAAIASIAN